MQLWTLSGSIVVSDEKNDVHVEASSNIILRYNGVGHCLKAFNTMSFWLGVSCRCFMPSHLSMMSEASWSFSVGTW